MDVVAALREFKKLAQTDAEIEKVRKLKDQARRELDALVSEHENALFKAQELAAHIDLVGRRIDKLDRELGGVTLAQITARGDTALRQLYVERLARKHQLQRLEGELAQLRERKAAIKARVGDLAQVLGVEPPQLADKPTAYIVWHELPQPAYRDYAEAKKELQAQHERK